MQGRMLTILKVPSGSLLLYCWELSASILKLIESGLPTARFVLARGLWERVMGRSEICDRFWGAFAPYWVRLQIGKSQKEIGDNRDERNRKQSDQRGAEYAGG